MTISEFFATDHDEIDAILAAVNFDAPVEALARLKEFDRRLERHIVWEEEVLFPAAARAEPGLGRGPIAVMKMEHVEIRDAKARALERLKESDGGGAREFIRRMIAVLADHNGKEEGILYPACDELIPAEEAGRILGLLASSPR
jgi:iron-sulfur cluster repair protein YtfE (RIC family)